MKYVLEMDEEQAKLARESFELYARLKVGQFKELIDLCVDIGSPDYCEKRDKLTPLLMEAKTIAYPELSLNEGHSYGVGKFRDSDIVWEMNEVLRNKIAWTEHPEGGYTVNFDKPISFSGKPLAKCECKKD